MSPVATPEVTERPSLAELAERGPEELFAGLRRVLPGEGEQRVEVAAFNSSI